MNGQQSHFGSISSQQGPRGAHQLHHHLTTPVSSAQQSQLHQQYLLPPQNYLEAAFAAQNSHGLPTSMSTSSGLPSPTYRNNNLVLPQSTNVQIYMHNKDDHHHDSKGDRNSCLESQLVIQPEQLFLQMQQQYENQIRQLQLEMNSLKSQLQTAPLPTINPPANPPKSSASKRSQSALNSAPHIVETYQENIQTKEFQCKNCSYKTKSEASLCIHNTNHLVNQRYLHLPTTVFSVKPSSNRDSSTHLYPCGECSGKFSNNDLYLHIYQHHTGENPFHCDECELFFMHFEFLDDHQRSTHMKTPTKKKPRYNSAANNVQNSSSQGEGSNSSGNNGQVPPQLTYYSVVKCSKPFSQLSAISQGTTTGQSWSHDGLGGAQSQEISPMGSYPYHTAAKRGRGRGSGGVAGQNTRFSPNNTLMALQNGTSIEPDANGHYKCHFEECFFIADTKDRLEFHLFAHRSSRFKCPYCPYCSNVLNDIKRHVIKGGKHDRPMFNCPNAVCEFTTNCDKAFRDHIRSVHFGKQIDDKSLTDYIEELFTNTRTEEPLG